MALTLTISTNAEALRLENAIANAIPTNPDIKSAYSEARAKEHQIGQEKSGYYPSVDVSASAGHEYTKQKFHPNELSATATPPAGKKGVERRERYQPQITVVQPLFSGFDTVNRVQKAEDETTQALRKAEETQTLIAFQAAEAYIGVRRFQRLWRLAQENIKFHETIHNKVRQLVNAGKASKGDLHTVEARLSDARTAADDIVGDLSSQVAAFIDVTGIKPDRLENAKIDDSVLPRSLQESIDLALEHNRSVVLAKQSIKVTETDIKVAEAPYYPNVNIEADATHSNSVGGRNGHENNAKVLAVLRWNLFSGGRDLNRHREFKERNIKAKDDLMAAMRLAEREVRVSWGERTSAALQAEDRGCQERTRTAQEKSRCTEEKV